MADINKAMPYMLLNEGGYVNNPHDPGGPTNLGITIHVLSAWLGRAATIADVKALTVATVAPIYKHNYWDMLHLDSIVNQGCATAVFDMCVNFGPGGAKSMVNQTCAKLGKPDVNSCDPHAFIVCFESIVAAHYQGLVNAHPSLGVFLRGWMARAHRLLTLV